MSATFNGGIVSEIVTGTELRKLREDLNLVRNMASIPVNVEQVDRATVVSVLMAVDTRVGVMYKRLLGEEITSGDALFGTPMKKAEISYPPETPKEPAKPIIDYRKNLTEAEKEIVKEVRVKRKYTRHAKPAEEAPAETPAEESAQAEQEEAKPSFTPVSDDELKKLDNFIADIRLSKLVVDLGPTGPLMEEAREWAEEHGCQRVKRGYLLTQRQAAEFNNYFGPRS